MNRRSPQEMITRTDDGACYSRVSRLDMTELSLVGLSKSENRGARDSDRLKSKVMCVSSDVGDDEDSCCCDEM